MENERPAGHLVHEHAQYDDDRRRLYVAKRWGLLCLHASPFMASGIDLRASHNWTEIEGLRLDLRQPLGLIGLVQTQSSRLPFSRHRRNLVGEQPIAPSVVDSSTAWMRFIKDVGGFNLCRSISRYHPTVQYHALWFASRCPRLALLATSNPGLFVGVILSARTASSDPYGQLAVVQQLTEGREREISERLGFASHAWRFLARILPRGLTYARWESFRSAWCRSPRVRTISRHLPSLNALTVDLLSTTGCPDVLDYRTMLDLAQNRLYARSRQLGQVVRWAVEAVALHVSRTGSATMIRSARQLEQTVQFLDDKLEFPEIPDIRRLGFPRPPFPGEAGYIEPIETVHDLCFESIQMRNCAIAYAEQIAGGESYFYRAYARWGMPRCTIALQRNDDKECSWRIAEVRRRHNSLCGQQICEALKCFFQQQRYVVGRLA